MANLRLTEKLKLRRITPCGNINEIYLGWISASGAIGVMLFEADHGVTRSTGDSLMITNEPEDYASAESFISMIKKEGFRELSLIKVNADLQTREGLETILTSSLVKMLKNGLNAEWDDIEEGDRWQKVIVMDGQTDIGDTDEERKDFVVRIKLQPTKTLWR